MTINKGKIIKLTALIFIVNFLMLSSLTLISQPEYNFQESELVDAPDLDIERTQNSIKLSWEKPTEGIELVTGYKIYKGLGSETPTFHEKLHNSSVTVYEDDEVEEGRSYRYYITATYGEDNESDRSNEVTIRTYGENVPTRPLNLRAYPGNSKVSIEWSTPLDNGGRQILGYNVYRKDDGEMDQIAWVLDTNYIDDNVENGIKYNYTVKAINIEGESNISNEDSAVPRANISKPDHPRDLKVYSGKDKVELHWQEPDFCGNTLIKNYCIYKREENRNIGMLTKIRVNDTHYIDDDLEPDTEYYYTVTAVNGEGESPNSNEGVGSLVEEIPSKPIDFTVVSREDKIDLEWSSGDENIKSYVIYRGLEKTNLTHYKDIDITDKHINEFSDKNIQSGETYYYGIKAIDYQNRMSDITEIKSGMIEEEDTHNLFFNNIIYILGILVVVVIIVFIISLIKKRTKKKMPSTHEWEYPGQDVDETKEEQDKEDEIEKKDTEEEEINHSTDKGQISIERREEDEW